MDTKKLYTLEQIGKLVGRSPLTVKNKLSKLGLRRVTTLKNKALFSYDQILKLNMKRDPFELTYKYFPIHTETIYYIYESKMNDKNFKIK